MNLASGESVAWVDRKTGRISVLVEQYRDAALDALAPYLSNARPALDGSLASAATPQTPVISPQHDLALNRPGESLRPRVAQLSPGWFERLASRLLRRKTEADSWRAGLVGERIVGAELERLTSGGWRVLHSIPLPRDVDIDHLLIGPGGVFTINTKRHRKKRIWVGDDSATVNRGTPQPYVRKSRHEAERAARVLKRGCGFAIQVHPVLVFVAAAKVDVVRSLHDVRVVPREREVAALGALGGVLSPAQIEAVYAVARDRRNWLDA
ncbi:nuclease-related domain-containing protein [Streptomyces sp. 8N616]|uniref:nuclease-related domain-containing protein n=1 Tax=Streptomyces sp. 8N616 TaxID=3457414 RepID=UPI003FCFC5A2